MNEQQNEKLPLPDEPSAPEHENNEPCALPDDEPSPVADGQDEPQENVIEPPKPAAEPTVVYRWDYEAQIDADARHAAKSRRSGVLTFAIVMSACFLLTLLVLIGALVSGGLPKQGSELSVSDGESDVLSLQQISEQGNRVVVAISVKRPSGIGMGTGIIMTADGYIATNHHVIEEATEIVVQLYGGEKYSAEIIGSSDIDDLAVIKINAHGLPTATFGDSADVRVGDRAVVIGHPAGLEFGWTSTYGFVSAINRDCKIREYDGTLIKKMTLLQTDANVNNGNSGGPMFNDRGEVIGIINMKLRGDYEGMGFAIPSNGAVPLLEALMRTGTIDGVKSEVATARPRLGIMGGTVVGGNWYVILGDHGRILTEQEASQIEGSFYVAESGVWITGIASDSDAYGKLQIGDLILALGGTRMSSMEALREHLYNWRVGDTVEVTFLRDGKEQTVSVVLTPPEE